MVIIPIVLHGIVSDSIQSSERIKRSLLGFLMVLSCGHSEDKSHQRDATFIANHSLTPSR